MTKSDLDPTKVGACLREKESIRVLHVDDEAGFSKTVKGCLEMEGSFKVDTALSVDEALKKMKKAEYDAVVCDYQMPGKDGLEFLKQLREKGNRIPFIILTGKSREEVAIRALNLGADQYLSKTGDPEIAFCELAHDIHQAVDRRSAQIELLNRETKFRAVLESSPEAITVTDLNGNVVECNHATVDMHGFESKEDVIGKNASELIAEKDRQRAIQNLVKTIEQGSVKAIEYTFVAKDGREFLAELSASVVRSASGKPEYLVAITKDITERSKMEASLRRLAAVVSDSNDAITVMDVDGVISAWNKGAERMYGYSENEALRMNITDVVPEEKKRETAEFIERIKNGDSVESFETNRLTKDERVLNVWLTATRMVDDTGKVVAIATTERDITERNRLQEALVKSEKLAVIGQLASALAHEIRNPLGVIMNSTYFLNMKLKDAADKKIARHLKILEKEVNSANTIIRDLLEFAKKKTLILDLADLNETVKNALSNVAIPENIKTEIKLAEIPKMLLDEEQTHRVCLNLILNAVQAMPEGGRLTIQTTKQDDSAKLIVGDTGVGISKESMSRLFTPLFSTKVKGIGLGLVICRQIVESHDGNITVESRIGEGSTFTVKLPIRTEKKTSESLVFTVSMPIKERVKIEK